MSENTKSWGTSRFVKRILLCGLDKEGRSSIRRTVIKKEELRKIEENGATLSYFQWRLTKEYGRPIITVMDLGGRWSALEKGITTLSSSIFYGIQALLFVVDVTKEDKFASVKRYFNLILQKVRDYSPSARIFVFLNKIDMLPTSSETQKAMELLRRFFQEQLEDEIVFYETTIHDNSARAALFAIFKEIMPEMANQIEEHLQELMSETADQIEEPPQELMPEVVGQIEEPPQELMSETVGQIEEPPQELMPETADQIEKHLQDSFSASITQETLREALKELSMGSEVDTDQLEVTQPVEIPMPPIPTPPMPVPPVDLVTEPSFKDRDISAEQSESAKREGVNGVGELQEFLDPLNQISPPSIQALPVEEQAIAMEGKAGLEFFKILSDGDLLQTSFTDVLKEPILLVVNHVNRMILILTLSEDISDRYVYLAGRAANRMNVERLRNAFRIRDIDDPVQIDILLEKIRGEFEAGRTE